MSHVRQVLRLYKIILKLHRGLPTDLKVLGDTYAKDEFRRHKRADRQLATAFLAEWTSYANSLAKQVASGHRKPYANLGQDLSQSQLEFLREEQLGQLYELKQEAQSSSETSPLKETHKTEL